MELSKEQIIESLQAHLDSCHTTNAVVLMPIDPKPNKPSLKDILSLLQEQMPRSATESVISARHEKKQRGMTEVQKMLEALECRFKSLGEENCLECLYGCSKASWVKIQDQLALDLIDFLKAQEPRLITATDFANNPDVDSDGFLPCWVEYNAAAQAEAVRLGITNEDQEG